MVYTEIKTRNNIKYYYRVKNNRVGKKFHKERIYLGRDLNEKDLSKKIKFADGKLLGTSGLKGFFGKFKKVLKK